jgi:hypothetical protein
MHPNMTFVGSSMRMIVATRQVVGLLVLALVLVSAITLEAAGLKVKVLKACQDCLLPAAPACQSVSFHRDQAAVWVPETNIRIHKVSLPEQTEVSIYTDIEVSTAPVMYLPDGHIFRAKYAGPGIFRNPPCEVSFLGSNITTTNINFSPHWISVADGTPVYVHMDVKNWSPFEINPMAQDVYIYYTD